jgi:hypothetical protein
VLAAVAAAFMIPQAPLVLVVQVVAVTAAELVTWRLLALQIQAPVVAVAALAKVAGQQLVAAVLL